MQALKDSNNTFFFLAEPLKMQHVSVLLGMTSQKYILILPGLIGGGFISLTEKRDLLSLYQNNLNVSENKEICRAM